jgi:hypothetical protein
VNPPTYHLWFKPSGEAYKILRRTIEQLAQKLDAPMFEPHISLIGNLDGTEEEIIKKSESLAKSLKPFTAVLTEPAYRDSHFQCLFMLVDKAPLLMEAHRIASESFNKTLSDFMPHLSLVYGSYPEEQKKSVIAHLPTEIKMSFDVSGLYLVRANSPEPKDWHELGPFPME